MAHIHAAILADHLGHLDQFFGLGVSARRVDERRRHPHGSVAHCLADQSSHLHHLDRRRRLILVADYKQPDLGGAHVMDGIHCHALLFEQPEILGESTPTQLARGWPIPIVCSFCGAADTPSPARRVVIPLRSLLSALGGSSSSGKLDAPIISINPGETTSSCRLIIRRLVRPDNLPISAMRPLRIPMSARYHGFPVPSTIRPPARMSSKS